MEYDVLVVESGGGIEATPDDSGGKSNILEQRLARNGSTAGHEIGQCISFGNFGEHCVSSLFMLFAPPSGGGSSRVYWDCTETSGPELESFTGNE